MAETDLSGALIDIEVAYAEPDKQMIVPLHVPVGTSAREAVRRSGLLECFAGIDLNEAVMGVTWLEALRSGVMWAPISQASLSLSTT